LVTSKGNFCAELTQINFDRLWMQYGRTNLPNVFRTRITANRLGVTFLADANQASIQHSGLELSSSAIVSYGAGSMPHRRTTQPCRWASMSLSPDELRAASCAMVGRELLASSAAHLVHPNPTHLARLVHLHEATRQLATAAPDTLAHPGVTRALEHELVYAMVTCLADDTRADVGARWRHHSAIIKRLEELLEANHNRPIYLAEICAATAASERTLRVCCEEHFGMGPIRYLWLRRMHLVRRALLQADPMETTVTQVATEHGFWELGRFATSYRALFGEPPSASLRRPYNEVTFQGRQSGFA